MRFSATHIIHIWSVHPRGRGLAVVVSTGRRDVEIILFSACVGLVEGKMIWLLVDNHFRRNPGLFDKPGAGEGGHQ